MDKIGIFDPSLTDCIASTLIDVVSSTLECNSLCAASRGVDVRHGRVLATGRVGRRVTSDIIQG